MTTIQLPSTCRLAIGRRVAVNHRGQTLLLRLMQDAGSVWIARVVGAEGDALMVGQTVRVSAR